MAHYFTTPGDQGIGAKTSSVPLRLPYGPVEEVQLLTAPGVFSASRVDPGTSVLLRALPQPPARGTFLDIGCGYGPLTVAVAGASPESTLWAIDVNDHALELCRRNTERLGMRGVRCARPEHVPDDVRFDFIVSNPAIRIGKPQLHAMLRHWLDRLVPGGKAYLVVQKHLGADSLQRWLSEQGWPTERYASQKGFRILCCTTARDDRPE
ncbi:methyltransferase [Streptomyces sp. NPDC044780]|uniref:class I SAM-dependent methyltransferase n=1 Tax=unclassified Streptomyces TaxID=2593676 RepID=UPI0022A896CE|nr:methyltransferase [Streptomyces sp. S465]WAP59449.1 methyltransferase [Streptomyces sp. S465]